MNPIKKIGYSIMKRVSPIGHARLLGVRVGEDCRLIDVDFGSEPWLVRLGNHVSITSSSFITHDGGVWVLRREHPEIDIVRPIVVGDNVFIGSRSMILPGVTIGNDVVVGAGSIVTKDIPAGSVVAGIPARVVRGIDEYKARALAASDSTKKLSAKEKREYYRAKYELD